MSTSSNSVVKSERRGRPTKFNEDVSRKIVELTEAGKTVEQIAEILSLNQDTIRAWMSTKFDFSVAVKQARQAADELVETSLFRKAVGYRYFEESSSKNGPVMLERLAHPDTTACIFWLKNRKPDEWRDRTEVAVEAKPYDGELEAVPEATLSELLEEIAKKRGMIR